MKKTEMEKIVQEIKKWQYLSNLPPCIEGFSLSITMKDCAQRYQIFAYQNDETRRSFSISYDKATKEYLAMIVVGLSEFCDISYMAESLDKLEKLLDAKLEETLRLLCLPKMEKAKDNCVKEHLGFEFLQKKILIWPYTEKLPNEVSGFELFISPSNPLKVVNGSYIIIDYSDFAKESGLIIYYNIFRDEFFGEMKLKRTPVTTSDFDAKTLPELEDRIKIGLKNTLEALRSKL